MIIPFLILFLPVTSAYVGCSHFLLLLAVTSVYVELCTTSTYVAFILLAAVLFSSATLAFMSTRSSDGNGASGYTKHRWSIKSITRLHFLDNQFYTHSQFKTYKF